MRMHRLFVLAVAAAGLWAQDYRGSLLGRVTDPTGAVIPGAQVIAEREGTNIRLEALTNSEGNYLLPNLEPGSYTSRWNPPASRGWCGRGSPSAPATSSR